MEYAKMTSAQLEEEYASVSRRFGELKGMGLKLDMSRGKPGKEQLDLVSDILTVLSKPEDCVKRASTYATTASLLACPAPNGTSPRSWAAVPRSALSEATPA